MKKLSTGLFAAAIACSAGASALAANSGPKLVPGVYASTGQVASNNGSATCQAVNLTTGAANNSILHYTGAGKTGLTIYVPASGLLELCSGFPATPTGGLNGFSATAQCAIYSINGNVPPEPVNFSFTSTPTDADSAVGTTTISIPATDPVGGGCTATVNTTIVRTGK